MKIVSLRAMLQSNLLLGAIAIACGILAAWLGARHLERRAATIELEARKRFATSTFVVASHDLEKGQSIDTTALSIRTMPAAYAPVDALSPDKAGLLIGGRAAIDIKRGTPVVTAALASTATGQRMSERLPGGMRAMTIQVDEVNSLSGHLAAGDIVDLYYSRVQGSGARMLPLLQRVPVLATGHLLENPAPSSADGEQAGEFNSVTLLVSPADAQKVALAEQTGRLSLLLRHPADSGVVDPRPSDSRDLLSPPRVAAHQSTQRAPAIELLVGGNGGSPVRSWLSPGEGA